MENNMTEIVCILDRSGSMAGLESDVIGGFNATVREQKEKSERAYLSTVLFDTHSEVVHDRVSLDEVRDMTRDDYRVGGCTALYDAVGDAIKHISTIHKYIRPEDVPSKTVFVITTDGLENASRRYDAKTIKRMIGEKEKAGWEFLFLAANIDASAAAREIGIAEDHTAEFSATGEGVGVCYSMMCEAITTVRERKRVSTDKWRKKKDEE